MTALYLDAFSAVAKHKSFSAAAKELHITQSALSQRVLNLEQELKTAVFIREPSGIRLTEIGEKLLRYCHSKDLLEAEFTSGLLGDRSPGLKGLVRIGGYSTLNRSVLIPILGAFVRKHPVVSVDVREGEMREMPSMLQSGRAEFVFLNRVLEKQGIENHHVGFEENVLIEASGRSTIEGVYLDHDEEDPTTFEFFRAQGKKPPAIKRSFFDEMYAIIEGVRQGMGRAVVPMHIANSLSGVEIVKGYKPLKAPVYLAHYNQAFYTDLQKAIIELLLKEIPARLDH